MAKIFAITYDDVTCVRFTAQDATEKDAQAFIKRQSPELQKRMKVVTIDDEAIGPLAVNLSKTKKRR